MNINAKESSLLGCYAESVGRLLTDVSKEHSVLFGVLLTYKRLLLNCLTLKMKAVRFFEMIQHNIPERYVFIYVAV
jgi:hypothetical protein